MIEQGYINDVDPIHVIITRSHGPNIYFINIKHAQNFRVFFNYLLNL